MKLTASLFLFTFFLAMVLGLNGQAQERRLIVADSDDAELRRTALRLRMCPERLQQLRGLLDRATRLVSAMKDPSDVSHSFDRLAGAWVKLDRSRAESAIETLLEKLRAVAAATADSQAYMRATEQAIRLNRHLEPFLPDGDFRHLEGWPDPPPTHQREFDQWEERLIRQQMYSTLREDPLRALEQLEEGEQQFPDLNFRLQLIQRLLNHGSDDQASRLLDDTLEGLLSDSHDIPNGLHISSQLVHQTAQHFPERLPDALEAWYQQILMTPAGQGGRQVQIEGQSFHITSQQQQVLNTVRNLLHSRPTTALEILNWFPDLAGKLETMGGIDAYLNSSRGRSRHHELRQRQTEALQAGKAGGNQFRDYLYRYDDPREHVQKLIQASSAFYHDQRLDPARGRQLLDAAVDVAWQIEKVHELRSITQQLATLYCQLEGEFPEQLVGLFYEALDRLEAAEESSPQRPVRYHLIPNFVGRWLLVDRNAALSFLATRDDDRIELMSLLSALAPGGVC